MLYISGLHKKLHLNFVEISDLVRVADFEPIIWLKFSSRFLKITNLRLSIIEVNKKILSILESYSERFTLLPSLSFQMDLTQKLILLLYGTGHFSEEPKNV